VVKSRGQGKVKEELRRLNIFKRKEENFGSVGSGGI
jgi:hypothetical protein